MLGLGWHRRARARAMYLAYSFLQASEWFRLDYPVRLAVDYRPGLLADVLREAERAPSLNQIRNEARQALAEHRLPFTKASVTEPALRRQLLKGDRTAFARIVGKGVPSRRRQLSRHPGLAWRLQRTAPRSSAAEQLPEGPWVTPSPSPGPTPPVVPGGIPARPVRYSWDRRPVEMPRYTANRAPSSTDAAVAQSEERLICNQQVGSSILPGGSGAATPRSGPPGERVGRW
jgi:hypothetical protein